MSSMFDKEKKICLVGIGGISMSALAIALAHRGFRVYGSDRSESDTTRMLASRGIPVVIGHKGETVEGAGCVVCTAAVHDDNPELRRASELGIPIYRRSEAWGELMRECREVVCVCGCHGKSTTTALCTHIALEAGIDASVMIGANLPLIGGTVRCGGKDLFIAEACEYCDSFLDFPPTVAVVNNIEEDHLDYFKDLDAIKASFARFVSKVPAHGAVVANHDDANTVEVVEKCGKRIVWFGLHEGDVHAEMLSDEQGYYSFELVTPAWRRSVKLRIPGIYNVYNALASAAASYVLGIDPDACVKGIEGFGGISRRFELVGEYYGIPVIDDYAHHPTALRDVLRAVREMGYKRIVCVFQSHTYSRTWQLYEDFIDALRLADVAVVADIYAAREINTYGVSAEAMAKALPGGIYAGDFDGICDYLRDNVRAGDVILTVGAGDVYKVGQKLLGKN
ncbi:MAG: UDP-N-acetylmuramate--L-alanine ligase [Oscillospiraceae bacterium]|nr:UDP-N-acetylmuramate--L-alanine ligase [Oscillospiraceae bacterium]